MKKNVGVTDRVIRVMFAIIFVALDVSGIVTGMSGIILLVLAAILIVTAVVRFCPLYFPFGINTIRKQTKTKSL